MVSTSQIVTREALQKFIQTFLALSIFITAHCAVGAEVRYPDNPFVGSGAVFISSDGVHSYTRNDLQHQWSALLDEHTFEPVVHQHVLLVGSSRGLYALRAQDGRVLWHVEAGNEIFTPVVANGVAYAGSRNGTLYAFDAINGRERWRARFPGWVYSPAFFGDTLITGGQDATLWAVDSSNGEQRWLRHLPGEVVFSPVRGGPFTVLATTFAADLIAFDSASGTQQWRLQTPTANMTTAISGNRIFLTGFDGSLRKVNLDSGTVYWIAQLDGRLSSPRLVSGNQVLVSNDEGKAFVLSVEDGAKVAEVRFESELVGAPFVNRGRAVQFLRDSGQLSIVATTRIPAVRSAEVQPEGGNFHE